MRPDDNCLIPDVPSRRRGITGISRRREGTLVQMDRGGAPVLTARLSGQQVMINGNASYAPTPARLRSPSARNRGPGGAPAARRGRAAWTAARMSAVSWVGPSAVARKPRPSQKVTGLPWAAVPSFRADRRISRSRTVRCKHHVRRRPGAGLTVPRHA